MSDHPNLSAALVAALSDLTVIEKGRKANAGSYSYDYADIADVVKLTRPALAEHGIVALTPVHDHGSGLACSVVFIHASGDRMDFGPFPFPHGRDAQATGSMVTYHRRYALVAALGMAAGDDDDGAAAKPRQDHDTQPSGNGSSGGPRRISATNVEALTETIRASGLDVAAVISEGTGGRTEDPAEVLTTEISAVRRAVEKAAA